MLKTATTILTLGAALAIAQPASAQNKQTQAQLRKEAKLQRQRLARPLSRKYRTAAF